MPLISPDNDSIANASKPAVAALAALAASPRLSPDEALHDYEQRHRDEIGRLETWLSEHDVRAGTLDHKLREASHLRDRILALLSELSEISTSVPAETARPTEREDETSTADSIIPADLPSVVPCKDNQSAVSNSLSLDTSFTLPESVPDSPLTRAHDTITLLFELSPSLFDPTPHNRFTSPADSSAAEPDINHVRTKFSKANERLIRRLGRANWERRVRFGHIRTALDMTLSEIQNHDEGGAGSVQSQSSLQDASSDALSALSGQYSDYSDDVPQRRRTDLESRLDYEAASVLTSPTTASNHESSAVGSVSTGVTEPSKRLKTNPPDEESSTARPRFPRPPHPNTRLTGQTFLCPFCSHTVVDMISFSEWRRHILEDMEPYMCTYTECMLSEKTYGTKQAWWDHETDRHRTRCRWICAACQQHEACPEYETSGEFEEHLKNDHPIKLTPVQMSNIREMCQRAVGRLRPQRKCPLCQLPFIRMHQQSRSTFERTVRDHIAHHLEDLALFVALPAGQLDEDTDSIFQDDSIDSNDNIRTEVRSVVSERTQISRTEIGLNNVKAFIADQQRTAHGGESSPAQRESSLIRPSDPQEPFSRVDPDTVPKASGPVAPIFPLFLGMPPRSEHFYSRDGLLVGIHKVLQPPGSICLAHGIGGVGKTYTAVQYAYKHRVDYDAIFWVQADTAPGLADSYSQIVSALGLANSPEDHHQIIAKGRTWLQETDRRWLVVFDNALSWNDISRYMPDTLQQTNGSVLITSHFESLLPSASNVKKTKVDPLSADRGAEMLLRYLSRDPQNDPEQYLAREISAFVGGLPVAINHVAGYIAFSEYSLDELIQTFKEWRRRTGYATDEADDLPASFRHASFSYDGTLQMVWEVTLRELPQEACDVLDILAYLNCAAIPQKMIWRIHEDPSLSIIDSREQFRMKRINRTLVGRRLVNEADGHYSMHRSLQRGIRQTLAKDRGKQQRIFDKVVALIRENFPRSNPLQQPTPEKWSEYQKHLPHLHALREVYHASQTIIRGSADFAQLLLDAGMDQFEQGIANEGLLLLQTAEKVLDASEEPAYEGSNAMKADVHTMIALTYDDIGITKRQEGFKRRALALDIRRKAFDSAAVKTRKDETLVYNSRMEYAISLLHNHRHEQADPIIEQCHDKFREWGSEETIPFEYAKYYNKKALVRLYQGRLPESIQLAARGSDLMEKTGYKMFATRYRFDLACYLLQSGEHDEALRIHKEIFEQRIAAVGSTNQLSLHSMYAIGAIYELKGDLPEAEVWFRKTFAQRRALSTWPDEAYSRSQYHLAKVVSAQGVDDEETRALHKSALEAFQRLLQVEPLPPELSTESDTAILFDHMLPVSGGGARFTGIGLLERFTRTLSDSANNGT